MYTQYKYDKTRSTYAKTYPQQMGPGHLNCSAAAERWDDESHFGRETHMEIDRLDHLVLTVRDVKATCEFYTEVLGMREVTFAGGRKSLLFGSQKINLHEYGNELEPKSESPTPSSAGLCFITRVPLAEVLEHVRSRGVQILEGPVERAGALGPMVSIYFRDPDGNLIEVSNYGAPA